jgi:hypothetical protein
MRRYVILFAFVAGCFGHPKIADAQAKVDTCEGILHRDQYGIEFGGAHGEGEGICVVNKSQEQKVLEVCSVEHYCNVRGLVSDCKDSGECVEITNITSVRGRAASLVGVGVLDVWLKARESADAPNDQKVTLYKRSKALVIGMDHYSGAWPQLSNGVKDAEEVAKALSVQGFEVTLKKDLKSEELDRTLKNFFVGEGADVDTRLLLWFAGHGYTVRDEGYIVPVDAPSPKADADFREKAISLRRFGEYMREANSRHVLAIFDSCFGGSVFNVARSMPPPAITLATTEPVREFISSGEADQQVSDDGTFRKLFLDVLAGKEPDADANHDGYVTGTELGLFLHQKMTNLTYNRQTPRYGKLNAYGYDRGDFVFQVGKPDVPTIATVQTPQPTSEAAQAWAATQSTISQPVLESFIRRYSDSFYADLARARLEELKKTQVAVVAPPVAASSKEEKELSVQTRYGEVSVIRDADDCCKGIISYGAQKIAVASAGSLLAGLDGVYQVKEGDVVVLHIASGGSGTGPDPRYVLLVDGNKIADLSDGKDLYNNSWDETFKITQKGDEIYFDLGLENRRKKSAVYRGGTLSVALDAKAITSLPKEDCAALIKDLSWCVERGRLGNDCNDDAPMGLAGHRYFTMLEDSRPFFKESKFLEVCTSVCKTRSYDVTQSRKLLCGY